MPEIRFRYQPPTAGAHQVGLAGDFTGWEIHDLIDLGGIYLISLPIEGGRYRYKFIVDGEWMSDPGNPEREPDPFGGFHSVLTVRSEGPARLTWEKVWGDPGLLAERGERYIRLNRMSATDYELRFIWHPGMPAQISACIDNRDKPLVYLGSAGNQAVYHCVFNSSAAVARLSLKVSHAGRTLLFGQGGFSPDSDEHRPLELDLASLPAFGVPDWVQGGVIYQIFPDRFCDGDPALHPDFSEWYYVDCRTPPPPGQLLPPQREYYHLVEDWNDIGGLTQSPWMEKGKPDWWSFYGGNLPGVLSQLAYLSELGVTVIYFNPLWQAKSNHKYDAADFCRIDPHFGSLEDMRELVRAAHELGMRIIVDMALNHTGEAFWAFRDCVEKGPDSAYWSWYDWLQWPLPRPLPQDFRPRDYYQCWWGIKDMPDLNYDLSRPHPAENYIHDIGQAVPNRPLVKHLQDCVQWWLSEVGIDGFRLDVPDEVPFWFWKLFRGQVKNLNPDAWIVGEIWHSAQGWVGPDYFDSVMNYAHFKDPVLEFFILRLISKREFCSRIEAGLALYPLQALRGMMNLLGSHDTVRVLELARGDRHRLRLAWLFQMTFIGAPHLYYGDEIGLRGGRDPDNRRPFDWNWAGDPEKVELRSYLKELIRLRKSQPLVISGEFAWMELGDGLLAYRRFDDSDQISVVINISSVTQRVPIPDGAVILFTLGGVSHVPGSGRLESGAAVVYAGSE